MTPAITLAGVTRRFGGATALAGVDLEVGAGEMFGLIGPDGAGKTTAIRLMCGLLRPDHGSVRILGRDPVREHRHVTGQVGYLSQRFTLYGDLTVDENIAFFAEVHGRAAYHARRDQLLDMTRLAPFRRRLAGRLSGGMKQKLALACTLVHEPRVLILDEPTTGVDPVSRREFWKLLSEFLSRGMTILMSTPYLDEAERCGRVGLLHEGRVLDADTPSRIRSRMPGRVVEISAWTAGGANTGTGTGASAGFGADVELVRRLPGVADAQVFGDRLHVTLAADAADAADAVERFAADLGRTSMAGAAVRPVPPSLEDVFIAHLSGKEGTA